MFPTVKSYYLHVHVATVHIKSLFDVSRMAVELQVGSPNAIYQYK